MTVYQILQTVQGFAQLYSKTATMDLAEFNLLLQQANIEFFKYVLGYEQSPVGVGSNKFRRHALLPFTIIVNYSAVNSNFSGVECHRINFTDHEALAIFAQSTASAGTSLIEVPVVNQSQLARILNDSVIQPTAADPVAYRTESYIYVFPRISSTTVYYVESLSKPTTPALGLTMTNGAYASYGSTELEWDSIYHIDIVRLILGYLGIKVGNADIAQYMETQVMKN